MYLMNFLQCPASHFSVPDSDTLAAMKRREHSLQHTKLAQRAYSLPCSDRRAVTHAIALRVVREFGLPDTTVEILLSAHALYMEEPLLEVPRYIHHSRLAAPPAVVARPHLHPRCIRHTPSNPVSPARSFSPIEVSGWETFYCIFFRNIHFSTSMMISSFRIMYLK